MTNTNRDHENMTAEKQSSSVDLIDDLVDWRTRLDKCGKDLASQAVNLVDELRALRASKPHQVAALISSALERLDMAAGWFWSIAKAVSGERRPVNLPSKLLYWTVDREVLGHAVPSVGAELTESMRTMLLTLQGEGCHEDLLGERISTLDTLTRSAMDLLAKIKKLEATDPVGAQCIRHGLATDSLGPAADKADKAPAVARFPGADQLFYKLSI